MLNLDKKIQDRRLSRNLLEHVVLRIDYKDIVKIDQTIEKEILKTLRSYKFDLKRVGKVNEAKISLEVTDKDQISSLPIELLKSRDIYEYGLEGLNETVKTISISPFFIYIEQKNNMRDNYSGFESLYTILKELIGIIC